MQGVDLQLVVHDRHASAEMEALCPFHCSSHAGEPLEVDRALPAFRQGPRKSGQALQHGQHGQPTVLRGPRLEGDADLRIQLEHRVLVLATRGRGGEGEGSLLLGQDLRHAPRELRERALGVGLGLFDLQQAPPPVRRQEGDPLDHGQNRWSFRGGALAVDGGSTLGPQDRSHVALQDGMVLGVLFRHSGHHLLLLHDRLQRSAPWQVLHEWPDHEGVLLWIFAGEKLLGLVAPRRRRRTGRRLGPKCCLSLEKRLPSRATHGAAEGCGTRKVQGRRPQGRGRNRMKTHAERRRRLPQATLLQNLLDAPNFLDTRRVDALGDPGPHGRRAEPRHPQVDGAQEPGPGAGAWCSHGA
mmetsp:Transcript_58464/g.190652  ORF Transcript_58464/g.190652 Transcript_58464/m.190652 type:complete len:355 (-) Transcript_58464:412-1476(-)